MEKPSQPFLSPLQQEELQTAWTRLEDDLRNNSTPVACDLLRVVQLSDQKTRGVDSGRYTSTARRVHGDWSIVQNLLDSIASSTDERINPLLSKLGNAQRKDSKAESTTNHRVFVQRRASSVESIDWALWEQACQQVRGLNVSLLEHSNTPHLSLPSPPVWVDSVLGLREMQTFLQSAEVLGVDTEWATLVEEQSNVVATIQFAIWNNTKTKAQNDGIMTWVVDLLANDEDYQVQCKILVRRLFVENILLGFAVGHDIPKLEAWLGDVPLINKENVLDVQRLWKERQPPGLAHCANKISVKILSKKQQCSNWSLRPLSNDQLEHAALDAAVLLALVAENASLRTGQIRQ